MNEADEAARALRKLQELTNKYSNLEMDADELNQSISERINATEELKDIIVIVKLRPAHLINLIAIAVIVPVIILLLK